MIKRLIFMGFVLLYANELAFAQIPDGYYNGTEGLSGEDLQWELYNIIKGHKIFPYTASTTDVWDILKDTDRDTLNPNNVLLIYSGLSVDANQEYNNGNGWTREHVWAKSRGDFGTDPGPGTDVHHLRPENDNVNSARSNRWFANCNEPVYYNNTPTGCFISSKSYVFKPRPQVMGDVARMIFYMATRYKGKNGEPNLTIIDYIPVDDYTNEPVHAKLTDLLEWHRLDPVDNWERRRNDIIFNDYQQNRNPFIDFPEFAQRIWDTQSLSPVFTTVPNTSAYINTLYTYSMQVTWSSNPQQPLSFSLDEAPEWLSLTDNGNGTAMLSGTPAQPQIGKYFVNISVDYGEPQKVTQTYYLDVKETVEVNNVINSNVEIYPNPAAKFLNIKGDVSSLEIYNNTGQIIQKNITQFPVNVTEYESGIYLIKAFTNSEIFHYKLLIQH